MNLELEEQRRRYQRYRAGFALIAVGVGLLFIDRGCWLALRLSFNQDLFSMLKSDGWAWAVGAPITWTTFLGSYFLWIRPDLFGSHGFDPFLADGKPAEPVRKVDHAPWQRSAGLLVVMNGIDLITWAMSHFGAYGADALTKDLHLTWLLGHLSQFLGWAEFIVFANLAAQLCTQFGRPEAAETSMSVRSMCTIGLVLCAIAFISQTDWAHGWPLGPRRVGPRGIMLLLGTDLLGTITAFQVTALSIAACRLCGRAATSMRTEDQGLELLRSRSEPFEDTRDHWPGPDAQDDPWRNTLDEAGAARMLLENRRGHRRSPGGR